MKNLYLLNKKTITRSLILSGVLFCGACTVSNIKPFDHPKGDAALTKAEKRYWHHAKKAKEALVNAGVLQNDVELESYLNDIAKKLYPEYADRVKIHVVDNPSYNAFAMPNGDIYIHSAMLGTLENEAQIAIVIGHEIAHFVKKHGAIRANKLENGMASGAVLNSIIPIVGLLGQSAAVSSIYGLSRDNEREADRVGYEHFVAAGYPVSETVKAFAILQEESELGRDEEETFLFASHPKLQERIDSFNELINSSNSQQVVDDGQNDKYKTLTASITAALPQKFYESGRYDQLLKHISNERRQVDNRDFYLAMARLKLEKSTFAEVEPLLVRQINQYPAFAEAHKEYGYLLADNQRLVEASKYLNNYLTLEPESLDKWFIQDKIKKINNMEQQ